MFEWDEDDWMDYERRRRDEDEDRRRMALASGPEQSIVIDTTEA